VPLLPPFIGRRAQILHFLIARLQCVPKPRFLGLIKKAHLASAINARLIDASHRIFCQFIRFHRAPEHT